MVSCPTSVVESELMAASDKLDEASSSIDCLSPYLEIEIHNRHYVIKLPRCPLLCHRSLSAYLVVIEQPSLLCPKHEDTAPPLRTCCGVQIGNLGLRRHGRHQ
ncbi:Os05g0198301 [Oryza sativa Japonica Group]|uniref:Os05g0198301 protein n=2 Tax=Oryza sativa subsp. japonica TaxID=39947 RepID=B9FMY5_ORYSJ|nr:hypothetical protein OsJ_17458 [Oryza sativa Japonica Group]BAS92695.1 Os05g0198301 [Oryza sativa Japonica Group]